MSEVNDIHYNFKDRDIETLDHSEILELDEYIRKKLDVVYSDSRKQKQLDILTSIALKSPSESDRIQANKKISIIKKQMETEQKRRLLKNYLTEVIPVLEKIEKYTPVQYFGCSISKTDENYKYLVAEKRRFTEIAEKYAHIQFKKIPEVLCDCSAETIVEDGFLICKECGVREPLRQENVGFKDLSRINIAPKSNYDPKQNFDNALLRVQAKKSFSITPECYELLENELESMGIELKKCKKRDIYEILKRNKMSGFFQGIDIIHHKFTEKKPVDLKNYKEAIDTLYYIIEEEYKAETQKTGSLQVWFKIYKIFGLLGIKHDSDNLLYSLSDKSLDEYEDIWSKIEKNIVKRWKKHSNGPKRNIKKVRGN